MTKTRVRPDTQVWPTASFDDTVAAGAAMESSTSLEDDLNNLRSQVKRFFGTTNWYDDISGGRTITSIDTDLTDLEGKRVICGVEVLQDVTVPANAFATGTLTTPQQSNLVDGETFTISDNINPTVTFEFDTNASVSETATLRQVDISAAVTAIDVADQMVTAINNAPNLNWTADNAAGTSATVTITHDLGGTHGNGTLITETVADAGFTLVQPTGGAGDVVTLVQASSETPTQTAAVDAGTALGAIVAVLSGDVGVNALTEVAATNPTVPKNRCLIHDAALREGITATGAYTGRQIYALIQAESGTTDGESFNDTDTQVQLSFVMIVGDDLVPAPGQDIGGKTIQYIYPHRVSLDTLPEDCNFPFFAFTDGSASVSVTLDNALDNQGTTPATQETDIYIDQDAGTGWHYRDANSVEYFGLHEGSGGGTTQVHIHAATDEFLSEAVVNNMDKGLTVNTDLLDIRLGVVDGQIDSAGALTLASQAGADLTVQSANEIVFTDTNKGTSTYTGSFKLSETDTEWNTFETEFGEVSLLNAIAQAKNTGGLVRTRAVAAVTAATIAADTNVTNPTNIDAALLDYSALTFVDDCDIYLNGTLLRNGADASANHDVYPGDTPANGDLKFEFLLRGGANPDVITMVTWAGV